MPIINKIIVQNFILIVVASAFITSCNPVKHNYRSGDYDKVVEQSVKKLRSNPNDDETITYLEASYAKLYRQRMDRVNFLKKEGRPENVLPVYDELSELIRYGNMIRPLLPLNMPSKNRVADFNFIRDEELIAAKLAAAEYLYVNANQLLNTNDRMKARKASELYEQLKCIYPSYKDADDKLKTATIVGTNQVFVKIENHSNTFLFDELEKQFTTLYLYDLNEEWLNFYGTNSNTRRPDYDIIINIREILVTRDLQSSPGVHSETKSIQDGWNYELDAKGNVKQDSLGNDIKTPRYKTIQCVVTEYLQEKSSVINGSIDFYDTRSNTFLYTEPFSSNKIFQHHWASANGDLGALSKESATLIKFGPIPYPSELDMLVQGSEDLKLQVKNVIRDKKNLVRN